jgi:multicomponent Na+:H+ antiporter subunit C
VSVFPYVVAVLVFLVGIAGIATSRHLIHLIVCLGVAQSGTYVLLLALAIQVHRRRGTMNPDELRTLRG